MVEQHSHGTGLTTPLATLSEPHRWAEVALLLIRYNLASQL